MALAAVELNRHADYLDRRGNGIDLAGLRFSPGKQQRFPAVRKFQLAGRARRSRSAPGADGFWSGILGDRGGIYHPGQRPSSVG